MHLTANSAIKQCPGNSDTRTHGRKQKQLLVNPTSQYLNPKWFDKPFDWLTVLSRVEGPFDRLTALSRVEGLTTLSQVEGQIQIFKIQLTKTYSILILSVLF